MPEWVFDSLDGNANEKRTKIIIKVRFLMLRSNCYYDIVEHMSSLETEVWAMNLLTKWTALKMTQSLW